MRRLHPRALPQRRHPHHRSGLRGHALQRHRPHQRRRQRRDLDVQRPHGHLLHRRRTVPAGQARLQAEGGGGRRLDLRARDLQHEGLARLLHPCGGDHQADRRRAERRPADRRRGGRNREIPSRPLPGTALPRRRLRHLVRDHPRRHRGLLRRRRADRNGAHACARRLCLDAHHAGRRSDAHGLRHAAQQHDQQHDEDHAGDPALGRRIREAAREARHARARHALRDRRRMAVPLARACPSSARCTSTRACFRATSRWKCSARSKRSCASCSRPIRISASWSWKRRSS